jgi:hypothetical protein
MDDTPSHATERRSARAAGNLSNRFLSPEELGRRGTPKPQRGEPANGGAQLFPDGQWQVIRVQLEREGWDPSQIDLVHSQLRQGWSLAVAKGNVARLSGRCPINARSDH